VAALNETDVRTTSSAGRLGPGVVVALALLGLFAFLLFLASLRRPPIVVDIGPSTGRYGSGFEDSEETPPTTSRWTRQQAEFDIPLQVDASPVRVSVRAARYLDDPTRITLTMNGKPVADFEQPRGRQRIQEFEAPLPEGPLNLGLHSEDPKLGMALDWIRIEGARFRVPVSEWTVWILPPGIFAALLLGGASMSLAGGMTAILLLGLAGVAAVDPFGFVHVMRDVSVPAVVLSLLAALAFRGQAMVVLAVTMTVFLKGGFLFHPNFFYNDVRQNDRFVGALKSYPGGLLERSTRAQIDLGVGYPRIIGGKKYAFPYSPVFYWPFTALPADRDIVIRALKHVAIVGAALEVALVFLLTRTLAPGAAAGAAWLAFAFPIVTSRLLYAMWSTVVAHSLDLLMILLAVRVLADPTKRKTWLMLFAAVMASLLTYVSSLFTVSAFLLCLALLASAVRWRAVVLWAVAVLGVVVCLYGRFAWTFATEILPTLVSGSGRVGTGPAEDTGGLIAAFSRIVLFGGWGFPCFALAGLALLSRRTEPAATVLKAYALAFLSLVALRGLSGGLFKDLKEVEFGGGALAILSALAIERISPGGARRLCLAGLVAAGVWMQYGHFERWSRLVPG
jgi:hypothetical protein